MPTENNQCYVYKWTHLPTRRWYIGSRRARGCHIHDGYICSSRTVRPMIEANPAEWQRTIIAVGTPEQVYELETMLLEMADARNDPRSYNKHNNSMRYYDKTGTKESEQTRSRKRQAHTGRSRPEHSECMRGRTGYWTGLKRPDQTGSLNPSAKTYVITRPDGSTYEVTGLKQHIREQGWPVTALDMVYKQYIHQRGIMKGYSIRVKH